MSAREIRVGIVGVGNCASSLVQGVFYYSQLKDDDSDASLGLMHRNLGGYFPSDIRFVSAFDIDARKVGKRLNEAIFSKPNCTKTIFKDIPALDVVVEMGEPLDGIAEHMKNYPEDRRFVLADKPPCDIVRILKETKTEILINYLPVGAERAVEYYANACLEAGTAFINCVPVFIASDKEWAKKFEERNIPVIGDDIKSQIGATIIHRVLAKLFSDRGVKIDNTYQMNVGGNTDFLNMLERSRLKSKKISKTEAVQSQLDKPLENEHIHIGPSDYVPFLNDNKICFLRIEGRGFGNIKVDLELRLSVEDSPNSAGVVIDAIRCCKLALDRKVGGVLKSPSAYFMKHPPEQYYDDMARERVESFIKGEVKS
ncbi:MAG: inositol-3-phosphate synthase [Proteobacteria bacterium]|nr:inositol-3-phosphate synthase [Pseudomonadota bacterium]